MKVSFDFDGTLDKTEVQEYAKELIGRGIDVWITTAREKCESKPDWNHAIFEIADRIGIEHKHIQFCNFEDKVNFIDGFIWHLDDDYYELMAINNPETKLITDPKTKIITIHRPPQKVITDNKAPKGISVLNAHWKRDCNEILEQQS